VARFPTGLERSPRWTVAALNRIFPELDRAAPAPAHRSPTPEGEVDTDAMQTDTLPEAYTTHHSAEDAALVGSLAEVVVEEAEFKEGDEVDADAELEIEVDADDFLRELLDGICVEAADVEGEVDGLPDDPDDRARGSYEGGLDSDDDGGA
jgi:hypothetical protein